MRKYKLLAVWLVICMTATVLGGCQGSTETVGSGQNQTEEWADSVETAPVLEYEVPEVTPGVLVSGAGYELTGEKEAVFQGTRLPDSFSVVEAATGQVVYTGTVEGTGYNAGTHEYIGYGEFTALETEGEYYIECERIGRSYSFQIMEDVHQALMEKALSAIDAQTEKLHDQTGEQEEQELLRQCRSLVALLQAYELFPQVHPDGMTDAENEIPDVLECAARQVEYLSAWQDEKDGSVGEVTAWYCAALAKFSYIWQKYDSVYATKYLQAADKAWKYMEKNQEKIEPSEYFFAAAELYRATGGYRYHNVVKKLGVEVVPDIEDEALTYGGITYVSTKRRVDVELCSDFLRDMMDEAEMISAASKTGAYQVETEIEEGAAETFFTHMTVMSVVNYVITNLEYATVIENHHSYLAGVNPSGINYLESDIWNDPVYTAQYLLILSEISSHE